MSATNEAGGRRHIVRLFCAMVFAAMALSVHAQPMPQDSWFFSHKWGSEGSGDGQFQSHEGPAGIAIASDGKVYVADKGNNRIQVFEQDGTFVRKWGSGGSGDGNFSGPHRIAIGGDGKVYVTDLGNSRIQVFEPDGTFVRKWGSGGSGDGQFSLPSGIAIGGDGKVYVTDLGNSRIQVFEPDGTFVRKWGTEGSLDGQFSNPDGISISGDEKIYIADGGVNMRIEVFESDGTFVRKWTSGGQVLAIGYDGKVYNATKVFEPDGTLIRTWGSYGSGDGQFSTITGHAVGSDGKLYVSDRDNHRIQVFDVAGYRIAPSSGAVPFPRVVSTTQRSGEPHLEVDYTVLDSDSPKVAVAIAAFSGGTNSLNNLIKMETFLEGSEAFLGTNIDANVTNQVVWDVSADVPDDYVNLKVRVMAQDERGLMAIDFITLPEDGEDPALTISRSPIKQSDMLPLWFWLVASGDASVTLTGAEVHGVGGEFDGQTLAQGTNTTSNGRNYLWNRLDVREATSDEVTRARTGPSGVVNQWTPRITVGPGDRPEAVNEWGFDTGYSGTNGWWVVEE